MGALFTGLGEPLSFKPCAPGTPRVEVPGRVDRSRKRCANTSCGRAGVWQWQCCRRGRMALDAPSGARVPCRSQADVAADSGEPSCLEDVPFRAVHVSEDLIVVDKVGLLHKLHLRGGVYRRALQSAQHWLRSASLQPGIVCGRCWPVAAVYAPALLLCALLHGASLISATLRLCAAHPAAVRPPHGGFQCHRGETGAPAG